jgi:hypothetical protein
MIKRHLTLPYTFYCVTDDAHDLHPDINCVMLPENYKFEGWWCKPYIFKYNLFDPNNQVNFYIDLDMVIVDNINCFMLHEPGNFIGLRNFIYLRSGYKKQKTLGSGILRWQNNSLSMIYDRLNRDASIIDSFPGDQEYIWHYYRDRMLFYPEKWCISYRWHYARTRNLTNVKVVDFHGKPKPHESDDQNIIDNWK